ncbi:MAG: SpoVR family protein [Bacteriovoracales bacterium]|nr:SpoVR family protein [Bacteriovoracales bacterium]
MNRTNSIKGELLNLKDKIEQIAKDQGLDFDPVVFEVCDYETINILAAQGGFPSRYPHWRFGMEYEQISKNYAYGLQKIYEMVVNTNPVYAYLLSSNDLVDQKIVMSHVFGHADFFKNNLWFSKTNRKMMDVMANNATKIRRYMGQYGIDKVENFIDRVISIDNLIDINLLLTDFHQKHKLEDEENEEPKDNSKHKAEYLQSYLRSEKKQKEKAQGIEKEGQSKDKEPKIKKFPEQPQRDIMLFLLENAPLEEWQADIIGILREESYYFLPQMMTKIMNEGWASYWHTTLMTEKMIEAGELVDFCDRNAGVLQMGRQQINPYKIGIELFKDIEDRWNKGRFGKEYQECDGLKEKGNWDLKLGEGRGKIFEVRKLHNDVTFIDEFLTKEFCQRAKLFTYKYNPRHGRFEIDSKDFEAIRQKLLAQLTNFGQPLIEIEDGNYGNRSELLLAHHHFGIDLDTKYAADTMNAIYGIWKRPVNLRTKYDDKEVIFCFNGKELLPLK